MMQRYSLDERIDYHTKRAAILRDQRDKEMKDAAQRIYDRRMQESGRVVAIPDTIPEVVHRLHEQIGKLATENGELTMTKDKYYRLRSDLTEALVAVGASESAAKNVLGLKDLIAEYEARIRDLNKKGKDAVIDRVTLEYFKQLRRDVGRIVNDTSGHHFHSADQANKVWTEIWTRLSNAYARSMRGEPKVDRNGNPYEPPVRPGDTQMPGQGQPCERPTVEQTQQTEEQDVNDEHHYRKFKEHQQQQETKEAKLDAEVRRLQMENDRLRADVEADNVREEGLISIMREAGAYQDAKQTGLMTGLQNLIKRQRAPIDEEKQRAAKIRVKASMEAMQAARALLSDSQTTFGKVGTLRQALDRLDALPRASED